MGGGTFALMAVAVVEYLVLIRLALHMAGNALRWRQWGYDALIAYLAAATVITAVACARWLYRQLADAQVAGDTALGWTFGAMAVAPFASTLFCLLASGIFAVLVGVQVRLLGPGLANTLMTGAELVPLLIAPILGTLVPFVVARHFGRRGA